MIGKVGEPLSPPNQPVSPRDPERIIVVFRLPGTGLKLMYQEGEKQKDVEVRDIEMFARKKG